jgi:RNA binding exosome subunit
MEINEKLKVLLEMHLELSDRQKELAQTMANLSGDDFERFKIDFDNLSKKKKNLVALVGDQVEQMTKQNKAR